MTRRRVVFLLMGAALCMARPLAAVAQDRTASSFDAPVPRSLPRVAGPALSGRGATREASHEIPTGAPPCTLSPETSHASLSLTKDGSGNPILSWSGTGPYTVTRSTSPGFTYQVGTLAQSTSATSFTDSGTSGSALVYYYDIADEGVGEISEAVWGLGYVPPIPPTVTSVSPLGAWVGDSVTITGENFDPIALENQVMWNQIPAAVDPLATNTTTTLHVTIPKGATQASVSVCAHQACSPVDTSNPNAVVEVATTPFTDIGTMAFDDAAVTGGHQLRVADRGTSAIYSVDPEVKGATAITTLTSSAVSQPMIPTFCLSDGSVLYTSGAGGTPSDTIYSLSRGGGTPTTYATTRDAQTNTCHGISPATGVTPRALAASPLSSGYAYIADAASGYIRRIQQGTTLSTTATTAIDPTYGGLYLGTLGDPCPFTTNPTYTGVVNAINAGGDLYGVNVSACPATNFLPGQNYGTGITSLVLNEVFFNWLWIVPAPGRALSFAQEASTHYGFLAIAFADEITRLPDPDIQIEPSMPTKVLISNLVSGIPYPSSNQTSDAQIRIDITASVANARVYLRVIDPADSAAYVQPVSCGSSSGCECGISGQMCDNKDAYNNFGFGSGSPYAKTAYVDMVSGQGSIILHTTAQYAGDNYQVQASYQPLSATTPVTNAHIKAQSGIITAWKRVFVERDRMFRAGGIIYAPDLLGSVIPAGSTVLRIAKGPGGVQVDNLTDHAPIAIFDTQQPYEGQHDEAFAGTIDRTSYSDYAVVPLVLADLSTAYATNYAYTASPLDGMTHYPDFSQGHGAGVGVLSGDAEIINGTGARFYDADIRDMSATFGDVLVEYTSPRQGMGAVPYLHFAAAPNFTTLNNFQRAWFQNKTGTNYLHLIGAENYYDAQSTYGGSTLYDPTTHEQQGCTFIWVQEEETKWGADAELFNQYTTVHELTHNFSINGYSLNTYHCSNAAWHPTDGSQECIMNGTYNAYSDRFPRFCVPHALTGGSSLTDVQVGIRQQVEPLPY